MAHLQQRDGNIAGNQSIQGHDGNGCRLASIRRGSAADGIFVQETLNNIHPDDILARLRDAYASLQKEIACVQGIAAEELKALTNGEKSLRELEKNRHQPMDDSTAMERRLDVAKEEISQLQTELKEKKRRLSVVVFNKELLENELKDLQAATGEAHRIAEAYGFPDLQEHVEGRKGSEVATRRAGIDTKEEQIVAGKEYAAQARSRAGNIGDSHYNPAVEVEELCLKLGDSISATGLENTHRWLKEDMARQQAELEAMQKELERCQKAGPVEGNQKDFEVNQKLSLLCGKLEAKLEEAARNDGVHEISESLLDGQIALLRSRLEDALEWADRSERKLKEAIEANHGMAERLDELTLALQE